MIIKMIKKLGREEIRSKKLEVLNKELENIKNNQTEMKNTITEMKTIQKESTVNLMSQKNGSGSLKN